MQSIPIGRYELPLSPQASFTVFAPSKYIPIYSMENFPPGFFLHPKAQEFIPVCAKCYKGLRRKHIDYHSICNCADAINRNYMVPTTAAGGLYPLAHTISTEREKVASELEPLMATWGDIHETGEEHLKAHEVSKDAIGLLIQRTTTYVTDALNDNMYRGNYNNKEKDLLGAIMQSMQCAAFQYISDNEKGIEYLAATTAARAMFSFTDATSRLLTARATGVTLIQDDFLYEVGRIRKNAMRLNYMVNLAETTAAALRTTLPAAWASHEIVNLKHWFKHGPSEDSSRWFNQQLGKLITVITNVNAQPKIEPRHFDKMADYTVQMCMFTTRTMARLARIIFEVRAATKAREYHQNAPLPGVSLADPGPRGSAHLGHLDQDMDDLPPPPRRERDNQDRDWERPRQGQTHGLSRTKSYYPSLEGTQWDELSLPSTSEQTAKPRERSPPPVYTASPKPMSPLPPRRLVTFGAPFTTLLMAMLILAQVAQAREITPTNNPNLPRGVREPDSDGQTNQEYIGSGMVVKPDFIYNYLGPKLINPHTKTIWRRLNTDSLRNIGPALMDIAAGMTKLCKEAGNTFEVKDKHYFSLVQHSSNAWVLVEDCSSENKQLGSIVTHTESESLNAYMKDMKYTYLKAPVRMHSKKNKKIDYADGKAIHYDVFGANGFTNYNEYVDMAYNMSNPTFVYKIGATRVTLRLYNCDPDAKPGAINEKACDNRMMLPCMAHKEIYSTDDREGSGPLIACSRRAEAMTREASRINTHLAAVIETGRNNTARREAKETEVSEGVVKRAIAAVAVGVGILASLVGVITGGINQGNYNHNRDAINSLSIGLEDARLTNLQQDKKIEDIQQFLVAMQKNLYVSKTLDWYKDTTEAMTTQFRTLVNTAEIAVNKLAISIMGRDIGKVNPVLLTSSELAGIATTLFTKENIVLSTDMNQVVPDIFLKDGQIYASLEIPVKDTDRQFDLFEITPVPTFSPEGNRIAPVQPPTYMAIQKESEGFMALSDKEARECLDKRDTMCYTPAPMQPAHLAGCGVAPFLHRQANCTYMEIEDKSDFYHTGGNLTCFSVKKPIRLRVYCPEDRSQARASNKQYFTVTGAGCFTFKELCHIEAADGTRLLTSTVAGTPYVMPKDIKFGMNQLFLPDQTITELTPPKVDGSFVSEIEEIHPEPRHPLPRMAALTEPPPLYNTVVLPAIAATIGVVLLLLTCFGCLCCKNRETFRYVKANIEDLYDTKKTFDEHREDFAEFRRKFAVFPSGTRTAGPSPAASRRSFYSTA